ncbi:MAG: peptidase [Myxococcales bacterium]|nr:peptidase [Myxococcales bacterium]
MKTLALVLLVSGGIASAAETNGDQFLRDLATTRNFQLGRPMRAQPTADGKTVLFLRSQPREPLNTLYAFDVATGQTRALLTPEQLLKGAEEKVSAAEKAQRERQRISTRGFSHFELSDDGALILVALSGKLYLVRRADNDVTELKTGALPALNATFSPDATKVAYVHERDLYVYDLKAKRETRLTRSTDPAISNGLAEFVAQEEMRRVDGFWWAPDGRALAFEEADNRGVEVLTVSDVAHPEHPGEPTFYPRPGKANAKVRVGIVAVGGGAARFVEWDRDQYPYLTRVSWREAAAPLTLVVQSRDEKKLEVLAVDKAGRSRVLVEEHDDAWLDLDPTVPRWLPDGKAFLWSSTVADWPVLQLRDAEGKLVRALSTPAENYGGLEHVDAEHRVVWFAGAPSAPERHGFRVSLDGGAPERLTGEPGVHDLSLARRAHAVWIDTFGTSAAAVRSVVHVWDGAKGDRVAGELPSVAVTPPFFAKEERVRVGALNYWAAIVRPRNFDAKKKYPVVVDVYAGPGVQVVRAAAGPSLMRQWMADHGVIVVAIDGRGTPGRGHDWERFIAGDFSRTIDDQVAGLQALGARYPEMDLGHVGITGWSFGGYESVLAVLKRGDVFHVAAAGAPVVDWRDYDTHYTEHYLGVLPENKRAYDASSLLTYVSKLARPLLIVHGTSDDNVYFFHTLKLAEALFRAGKPFELLPLPGFTHMVADANVKEQLHTRIMKFLLDGLRR